MKIRTAFHPVRWLLLLCTIVAALGATLSARAASSCDVAIRLDAVMLSTNVAKVGFPPLLTNNQNPTIYFRRKTDVSEGKYASCYVCHENGTRTVSDTWVYDSITGNSPVLTNWSGFLSYTSETNGQTSYSCTSTRTGPNTWSDPTCGMGGINPTDVVVSNRTAATYTLELQKNVYELVTTPNGSSVQELYEYRNLDILQTQPYALADFVASYTSGLNARPWPGWTNAARTGWAERGGRDILMVVSEDRAEFNAALTRLKYRIAVRGAKGERQTISWIERFTPNGSGPVVDTPLSELVTFTGQDQYLMATQQEQGKIVEPPAQAGRLEVIVVSSWSCDGINCGPGKGKVSTGSIDVSMSLGQTASGLSAGVLAIKEEAPRPDLATPQRLQAFVDPSVQVLRDGAVLRQVRAPQTLAQIVPINLGYEVRFFGPTTNMDTNGLFIPVGQPFSTWRVVSPTNNPNRLTVTQFGISTPTPLVSTFEWSGPDNAWALVIGDFRKEIRVTTLNGNDRTETFTVREINDQLTYQESRTWHQYGGLLGDLLISETIGAGGAALTTEWSYHTSGGGFGKVSAVFRPNGALELYEYDAAGRLSVEDLPFATYAGGRFTQYFYAPVDPLDDGTRETNTARTVLEFVLGTERRTYRSVRTNETLVIQAQTPGAAWNAGNNLITTNRTYSAGATTVESSALPDGTLRLITNPTATPGTAYTRSESFGQPNAAGNAVVDGTRHTTQFDAAGRVVLRETVDILSGSVLSRESYEYPDPFGPATRVVYLDGTSTTTTYQDCCAASSTTERDGTLNIYAYDALGRTTTTDRNGLTFVNTMDAMGNILRTTRLGTDGSSMIVSEATFDSAGRPTSSTEGGGTTTTTISSGGSVHTTVFPDSGERTEHLGLDGALMNITGNAVSAVSYEYGVEGNDQYTKETRGGTEWKKTYFDMVGRPYKTLLADNSYTESFYNAKGQLWKQRGFDGRIALYAYNARGEVEYTTLDVDNSGTMDLAGTDRIVRTVSEVSGGLLRTRTYLFPTAGTSNSVLVATREATADGAQFSETRLGATTGLATAYPGGGVQRVTQTSADGTRTVSYFQDGRPLSVTRTGAGGETLGSTTYGFDPHGRLTSTTDARTGAVTTYQANSADQIGSVTTPNLPGVPSQMTTLFRDGVGRVIRTLLPDGLNLTNEFTTQGQLRKSFGARTYPVEYGFDAQGRLTNMMTTAGTGWAYDAQRGWLVNKRYPDNTGPGYTYTADGRVQTRSTPRGITTTYGYTSAGDLSAITYNTVGPNLSLLDLDRLGRPGRVAVGTNAPATLSYHDSGLVLGETSGGLTTTRVVDAALNEQSITLQRTNGASLLAQDFTYDGASRLQSVSANAVTVEYTYLPQSPLVQSVAFRLGSVALGTARTHDALNRLTEIGSASAGGAPFVFRYGYNLANQRTSVTEADGSYWTYEYDALGQLTSGKKYFSEGTPVAGQQFTYTYDAIGNRTGTSAGGDASGGSLRSASYTPTSLNQYTSRTVPGAADVLGHAPTSAVVTVNGLTAYRKSNYWHRALVATNISSAVWQRLTNVSTLQSQQQIQSGSVFLPRTPESFVYDADGNLLADGRWDLAWDAENRLISFTSRSDTPTNSWLAGRFEHDWRGRRTSKVVSNWNGAAWVKLSELRFAWDGWRLLAELDGNDKLLRSYVWGADLSGTLDGAGGVGGLLAMIDHAGGDATYFYVHDGNGNVRALISAADGSIAAQYDYGPFHERLRATGPLAKINPFLAATKYQDWETGFYYYGFRYYDPSTGRWLSRDPIEENGGLNLYGFALNRPTSVFDVLGREPVDTGVIVLVPSEPTEGYDTTEASFVSHVNSQKDRYKWTVIEVENITDANEKLNKANCKCIKELNILGHANAGLQNLVGVNDPQKAAPGYGRLQAKWDSTNKKWNVTGMELFKGLKPKFCKPCTVLLRGCSAGKGEAGIALLKAIANATGCKAKGWVSPTTEATPYKGLPGTGFFGIAAGPDVEVDPDR